MFISQSRGKLKNITRQKTAANSVREKRMTGAGMVVSCILAIYLW